MTTTARVLLVVVCIVGVARPAAGDDEDPWDAGVPEEQQDRANALFAEANQLFSQRAHAPALAKYKEAIALWDHPLIQFNMAVTLIRLERVLEAAEALDHALRYGERPFAPELYQQALDYQTLVRKQLGYIEATCDQPGTRILLDGKPWFDAPGNAKVRVTAGEHSIVAERDGYLTATRRLVIAGGATASEILRLVPLQSAMIVTYRHPRWIPWTVLGAGSAIAIGGGVGFYLSGKSRMADFSEAFLRECPRGCEADLSMHPELADQRDAARFRYTLATASLIAGGAIAITGAVWAIVNRPRRSLPQLELQPTPGGAVTFAGWRF
jgi:hypothetical protein